MPPHPRPVRPARPAGPFRRLARCAAGLVLAVATLSSLATPRARRPRAAPVRPHAGVVRRGAGRHRLGPRRAAPRVDGRDRLPQPPRQGRRAEVGQRIEIPVVGKARGSTPPAMWQHPDRDREKVRRVVAGAARNHGVDPQLALAVSWQESGWQMGLVSHADAIGAMQVLPATGRWMEHYAGRPLDLRQARRQRHGRRAAARGALAPHPSSYAQDRRLLPGPRRGAAARVVRRDPAYVANVVAIKRRLEAGRPPS